MCYFIKIFPLIFGLLFIPNQPHKTNTLQYKQIDSLIREKHIHNSMMQLELLVLYQNALHFKPKDSVDIFKKLATLNAFLEQPKDAIIYSEKYIKNTSDFSILNDVAYSNIKEHEAYNTLINKYKPKISFLSFLFLSISLLGFLVAITILFTRNHTNYTAWHLSGLAFISAILILEYVIFTTRLIYRFPYFSIIGSFFALLYGPGLYGYFKSRTNNFKYKKNQLFHLFPAVFFVFYVIAFYPLDSLKINKALLNFDSLVYLQTQGIFICKVSLLFVYGLIIASMIHGKVFKTKSIILKPNSMETKIVLIYFSYVVCYVIYSLNGSNLFIKSPSFFNHFYPITLSIMLFYMSYMVFNKPISYVKENQFLKKRFLCSKYKNSSLTESLSNELKHNLLKLFTEEKIFKESTMSLELLSAKLNTSRHNTSQIINEHFNMSFFELINYYRIKEVQKILENNSNFKLKIIDVAYEVGFNNKVTFNKAFKKETLQTPSQFVSMLQKSRRRKNFQKAGKIL